VAQAAGVWMSGGPTIDQLFEAVARAASGIRGTRLELSPDLDLEDPLTRLGYALNILLSDLEFRHTQAENALKEFLDERTRSLRQSEEAVRLRDDFLAIVAHELNTPLTSLQLAVQGLRKGMLTMPPDKVEQALALAEQQTGTMRKLVDQILEVASFTALGRAPLRREDTELSRIISEAAEQLEGQLQKAGCRLNVLINGNVVGRWDRDRLLRVVLNLLGNALKFGPGKPIDVTVSEDQGVARIMVRDYGIGIAADSLPHIFGRFERGVPVHHYGGLGLGLFIVAEIVRAHGGSVHVDSRFGEGATFIVELPCSE
jgi:signal transduction histidine kinase